MKSFFCVLITLHLALLTVTAQWMDALVPDFKVNDDLTTFNNLGGSIGIDGQGNFLIAWSDYRTWGYRSQIFYQRYNMNAQPISVNFRIGHDTAGGPEVAVLKEGRFIVGWGGTVRDTVQLYCQRFSMIGLPLGPIVKINDLPVQVSYLDIGADSLGNFVCIWQDYRYGLLNPDIYCQRFDSSGIKIETNFRVNDDTTTKQQVACSIAVNKDGSFVVCWQDERSPVINKSDVYMQRYNKYGIPIGSNQLVNDNTNNVLQGGAWVSSNGKGGFVISWKDSRNQLIGQNGEVYFQIYDSVGNKIGLNKRADEPTNQLKNVIKCAMKQNGKFIIMWRDWRGGYAVIYAQRLDSLGNKIGSNFRIPVFTNFTDSYINDVRIFGDRVHSVWNDNRNGNYDVWCNVRSFQNPDSTIGIKKLGKQIPLSSKLLSAYPNPFNPVSKIKYQIAKFSSVDIKIYDLRGKEIIKLVNEIQRPGIYEVEWDGSNSPSGVYFCRFSTREYSVTRKMVLIR